MKSMIFGLLPRWLSLLVAEGGDAGIDSLEDSGPRIHKYPEIAILHYLPRWASSPSYFQHPPSLPPFPALPRILVVILIFQIPNLGTGLCYEMHKKTADFSVADTDATVTTDHDVAYEASEKAAHTQSKPTEQDPPTPKEDLCAWLQVVGAFSLNLNTW